MNQKHKEEWRSKQQLADQYGISVKTVSDCVREMRETGQYGDFTFLVGNKRLIERPAFFHYLSNRSKILNDRPYEKYGRKE